MTVTLTSTALAVVIVLTALASISRHSWAFRLSQLSGTISHPADFKQQTERLETMFEQQYIIFGRTPDGTTIDLVMGLTGGQAIEAFQLLVKKHPSGVEHHIACTVNPAQLVESTPRKKIIRNDTPDEVIEAKDRDGAKIALPGQYTPHVISSYTPVLHDDKRASNDCGIITIANILQLSYSDAKVQAFRYGWSSSKGMPRGFLELLFSNFNLVPLYRPDLCDRNLDYFENNAPDGVFLVYVASHVMPCIHGKLLNLSGTGWQTVQEVFEIQPLSVVESATPR